MPGALSPLLYVTVAIDTDPCRASVLPFQKSVNSVSGFANSVFYRFRFAKYRFLPFQIFKIPFHFFQAVFLLSIIVVFNIFSVSAF